MALLLRGDLQEGVTGCSGEGAVTAAWGVFRPALKMGRHWAGQG